MDIKDKKWLKSKKCYFVHKLNIIVVLFLTSYDFNIYGIHIINKK